MTGSAEKKSRFFIGGKVGDRSPHFREKTRQKIRKEKGQKKPGAQASLPAMSPIGRKSVCLEIKLIANKRFFAPDALMQASLPAFPAFWLSSGFFLHDSALK